MATTPSSTPRTRRQTRQEPPAPPWRRWLLLGLLFGLGYGFTQRLLDIRWQENTNRPPAFRTKPPTGGVSLDELRRRNGVKTKPLPADLDSLARQKREELQKKEAAKQEEAARQEAAQRAEKQRLESERRRLEAFDARPEPTVSEPVQRDDPLLLTPPTPELPPPEPPNSPLEDRPYVAPDTESTPSQP
jgi:hypothetical protein